MKSQFAIFGLERIPPPNPDDEKTGQPYLFRQYPGTFESLAKCQDKLRKITENKSAFVHFKFDNYVILETYSPSSNASLLQPTTSLSASPN